MADTMSGLYSEAGVRISTHSMLKTFRRCPKQAQYKYVERLKPKRLGRPLRLGTWMHKLEEAHGKGKSWKKAHKEQKRLWLQLFEEERAEIGDLPGTCERLMRSYLWYYEHCPWKILDSEFMLECDLPDGSIYRCKIDWLVEDQFGLWIVDHKWHKKLPELGYRIKDSQSADYVWCALKNKIPVQGHIWNYGLSTPPSVPVLTKTGLISRWDRLRTDYPTMVEFFKKEFDGSVPQRYRPKMRMLKAQQYQHGSPQTSPFFRRAILERTSAMLNQVAREAYHTHRRMHSYPYDRPEIVERVPDRSCDWMCSYEKICTAELLTGSRPINWQREFEVGDPLDYYYDEKEEKESNGN
jgi:PD-(D/E)XK nuclease superfamily